jgi:hypothetical protein
MEWDGMWCVQVLADPDRRRGYDEGVDIKVKRGRKDEDDDSEEEVSWNSNNYNIYSIEHNKFRRLEMVWNDTFLLLIFCTHIFTFIINMFVYIYFTTANDIT